MSLIPISKMFENGQRYAYCYEGRFYPLPTDPEDFIPAIAETCMENGDDVDVIVQALYEQTYIAKRASDEFRRSRGIKDSTYIYFSPEDDSKVIYINKVPAAPVFNFLRAVEDFLGEDQALRSRRKMNKIFSKRIKDNFYG